MLKKNPPYRKKGLRPPIKFQGVLIIFVLTNWKCRCINLMCRNNTQQTQTIVFSSAGWAYSTPCQKLSVGVLTRIQCGTNHNHSYMQTLVSPAWGFWHSHDVPQTFPHHTIRPWTVSETSSSQFVSCPAGLHSHRLLVHYPVTKISRTCTETAHTHTYKWLC